MLDCILRTVTSGKQNGRFYLMNDNKANQILLLGRHHDYFHCFSLFSHQNLVAVWCMSSRDCVLSGIALTPQIIARILHHGQNSAQLCVCPAGASALSLGKHWSGHMSASIKFTPGTACTAERYTMGAIPQGLEMSGEGFLLRKSYWL